ncbi:MAG: hypothetical protein QM777_05455 [Pseudorhodoferax sp.]
MVSGFGQGGLGSGDVQFDQLFDAFEGLGSQAEQQFEVGFVGGNDLVSGQHVESPVLKMLEDLCCSPAADPLMLQCSMERIIRDWTRAVASLLCCIAAKLECVASKNGPRLDRTAGRMRPMSS